MVKQTLARLERAIKVIGGRKCTLCGGSDGVGGMPLIRLMGGIVNNSTYDERECCRRCGSRPPNSVHVVLGDAPDEETM